MSPVPRPKRHTLCLGWRSASAGLLSGASLFFIMNFGCFDSLTTLIGRRINVGEMMWGSSVLLEWSEVGFFMVKMLAAIGLSWLILERMGGFAAVMLRGLGIFTAAVVALNSVPVLAWLFGVYKPLVP